MTDYYQLERQNYSFGFGSRLTPTVKLLLILNAAIFFFQLILPSASGPQILGTLGMVPSQFIHHGAFWQPLTGLLLHGNLWALLTDLLALWFFAPEVEFGLGGGKRLLFFYFGCGAVSNLIAALFAPSSVVPILGPAGAIFAILTAFAVLFPQRVITLLLFFVLPVQMKAKYLVLIFGLVEWLSLAEGKFNNIGAYAALAGIPLGFLIVRNRRAWESFTRGGLFVRFRRGSGDSAREKEEYMLRKIDPILEKIARKGLHSLTWREKRILRKAKTKIRPK